MPPAIIMSISAEDVRRFMALFAGYEKAYGSFDPRKQDGNGKIVGRALTLRGTATEEIYRKHLLGETGLGVVMLREDDTVLFGAIDYDNKSMDHVKVEAKLRQLNLPLVLCRSKSGGGHFYCFAREPVHAAVMRDRLAEWTALLGMAATTEQFPKQSTRYNEDDVGSWINLPYFNAAATTRYAVHEGVAIDLQRFLDMAEGLRVPTDVMANPVIAASDLFEEGPPCLATLHAQGGFVEGTKKDGMFNVAVYLKKRHPDDWKEKIDEYNRAMANIKSDEIQTIVKSMGKKDYSYKCKQPPLNSCCQRRVCLTRMHGVGVGEGADAAAGFTIGSVTRYEPEDNQDEPMWGMEVNGRRVFVTTAQLYSRDDFNRACLSQANVIPVHMPPARWLRKIGEMVASAEIVPMPSDAGPTGQLWEHIEAFASQDVDAKAKSEIFIGKPWREEGQVYFRSMDLFKYLDARRVPYKSQQQVFLLIRKKGGGKIFWNIDKKGVNVWHVLEPSRPENTDQAPALIEQSVAF